MPMSTKAAVRSLYLDLQYHRHRFTATSPASNSVDASLITTFHNMFVVIHFISSPTIISDPNLINASQYISITDSAPAPERNSDVRSGPSFDGDQTQ